MAVAFMMLLVLGVTISTWQAIRARRAEQDAKTERDRAVSALAKAEAAKQAETMAKAAGVEAISGMLPGVRNAVNLLNEANRQRDEAKEQRNEAIKELAALRKELEALQLSQKNTK